MQCTESVHSYHIKCGQHYLFNRMVSRAKIILLVSCVCACMCCKQLYCWLRRHVSIWKLMIFFLFCQLFSLLFLPPLTGFAVGNPCRGFFKSPQQFFELHHDRLTNECTGKFNSHTMDSCMPCLLIIFTSFNILIFRCVIRFQNFAHLNVYLCFCLFFFFSFTCVWRSCRLQCTFNANWNQTIQRAREPIGVLDEVTKPTVKSQKTKKNYKNNNNNKNVKWQPLLNIWSEIGVSNAFVVAFFFLLCCLSLSLLRQDITHRFAKFEIAKLTLGQ